MRTEEIASIGVGEAIEKFITAKQVDGRSQKTLVKYRTELENFELRCLPSYSGSQAAACRRRFQ
jgi:hypothetical protein